MIKSTKRNAVHIENLNEYCHLSDKNDSMEVTEWINGEGWDVVIQNKDSGEQRFSLTYGQYSALQVLLNYKV